MTNNQAWNAIVAKARTLDDATLRTTAAETERQREAAAAAGNVEHARDLTTVLIALNHAADARWIDPHTYSEATEDRIDVELDRRDTYVDAVFYATR